VSTAVVPAVSFDRQRRHLAAALGHLVSHNSLRPERLAAADSGRHNRRLSVQRRPPWPLELVHLGLVLLASLHKLVGPLAALPSGGGRLLGREQSQ